MQNPLLQLLEQVPFTTDELTTVYSLIKTKKISKGEHFAVPQSPEREICFIQKGMLRNYFKVQDKEITYHFGCENTVNGTIGIFANEYTDMDYIQAVEDCELLVVNYNEVEFLFQNNIHFANMGLILIQKNFVEAHFRMTSFLINSAEERYELLAKRIPEVYKRVPLYQIASYLGIEPQSLSRLRKKMASNHVTA